MTEAVNLIGHRVKVVTGEQIPFNEIMSVAYMEDQRMAVRSFSLQLRPASYLMYCSFTPTLRRG